MSDEALIRIEDEALAAAIKKATELSLATAEELRGALEVVHPVMLRHGLHPIAVVELLVELLDKYDQDEPS